MCDCKSIAILMLAVGLVVITALFTLTLLNSEIKALQNDKSTLLVRNNKLEINLMTTTSLLENLRQENMQLELAKIQLQADNAQLESYKDKLAAVEIELTKTTSSLENLRQEYSRVEEELRQYKQSYSEKFWERFEVGLDRDGERLIALMKENTQLKNAVAQTKNALIKEDSECTGLVCQALTTGIKSFF